MKRYTMSFAAACEHTPEHAERTAKRAMGWDVEFQTWPSRSAMAKSIRMQQQRAYKQTDWKACVTLSDVEGY
jgi:zona occludens toxin (predicted ATPase)